MCGNATTTTFVPSCDKLLNVHLDGGNKSGASYGDRSKLTLQTLNWYWNARAVFTTSASTSAALTNALYHH
jgi:hypothetical protein